jgi:pantothenate kinase type III
MLLAIDCGNTNTVFSIWDGQEFIATWRTATEHQRTADQYFVWLSTLMSLNKISGRDHGCCDFIYGTTGCFQSAGIGGSLL